MLVFIGIPIERVLKLFPTGTQQFTHRHSSEETQGNINEKN